MSAEGASLQHNRVVWNLTGLLYSQLRGRECEAFVSDMRVYVPATGLFTCPDVTVVCGGSRFDDTELDTLLNPTLLVEVFSPSTEGYDRGKKFAHYRTLEALREYVLVAEDEARVEVFTRQGAGYWLLSEASRLDETIPLASIGCELRLADIYDRVINPLT